MGMGTVEEPRENRGNGGKTGGNTAGMGTVNLTNVISALNRRIKRSQHLTVTVI